MKSDNTLTISCVAGLIFGASVMESSQDDVGLILGMAVALVSLAGLAIAIRGMKS